jgi:hypothetical protein
VGALFNLGHEIGPSTIAEILDGWFEFIDHTSTANHFSRNYWTVAMCAVSILCTAARIRSTAGRR